MLALVALVLVSPVHGQITRGFDYAGDPFAAGHHRGIDLAAAPGTPVRAACSGRVTFAGRAGANGRAVTIRCGRWSVTQLPLHEPAVRAGQRVAAGTPLGPAAPARGHAGLHLGVRRASDPLGYVDPAPLLHAEPRPAPPAGPRAMPRRPAQPPPHPAPTPHLAPLRPYGAPAPHPAAERRAAPAGSSPLAPWPGWAGLALLLAGAAGAGATRAASSRARRRAALARPQAAAGTVPP